MWIGGGLLPCGEKLLLGGPTGIGKTLLLINLARSLTEGGLAWGIERFPIVRRARVLFIENEVGEYELTQRLKIIYGKQRPSDEFLIAPRCVRATLDDHGGRAYLRDLVLGSRADIIMLDPASTLMSGSDSSNTDVTHFMQTISYIQSEKPELSAVISHHFGNPPKRAEDKEEFDPLDIYNFRGASKWKDDPGAIATLVKHPGGSQYLWKLEAGFRKMRSGPVPPDVWLGVRENLRIEQIEHKAPKTLRKR